MVNSETAGNFKDSQTLNNNWSPFEKVIFRFVFLFFTLFIVFFNNGAYPLFNFLIHSFRWDGEPLMDSTQALPWKILIIDTKDKSLIKFIDGSREYCDLKIDTVRKQIGFIFADDEKVVHKFSYIPVIAIPFMRI